MMRALAFHTERLHDDRVWKRLLMILAIMRRRGSKATFFIYPFCAVVADRDISDRVRALDADYQQEIGQHTHFYAGKSVNKPDKRNDMSPKNIRNCIERDFQWLCRISQPRGFTAGGWIITEAVLGALVNLGFDYDCSARVPSSLQRARTRFQSMAGRSRKAARSESSFDACSHHPHTEKQLIG